MTPDVQRQADIMRASANMLAIVAPFTPEERLRIITVVLAMSGVDGELGKIPGVKAVLEKIRKDERDGHGG